KTMGLGPESRSINRIKTCIYSFFDNEFPLKYPSKSSAVQKIALAESNRQYFIDVIVRGKELYFQDIEKGKNELIVTESWEVPRALNYSENYYSKKVEKSILKPFFEAKTASTVEKDFADYLEKNKKVEWWFKNGD